MDNVTPTVSIPAFGRQISRMVMGTSFWRSLSQPEADSLFDKYVEHGGNCFDTALVYHDVEMTLGKWIERRNNREKVVIHAKGAHHETITTASDRGYEYHRSRVTPEAIAGDVKETLNRLQTDYIDIFTLHRDDPDQPVGPIIECLASEQKAGRIHAFGASNWSIARIEEALDYSKRRGIAGFVLNSPQFSLAYPNEPSWPNCVTACDIRSREWHQKSRFPLFAWSCLSLGFFTNQYCPIDALGSEKLKSLLNDRWTADVLRVYYSDRNFERLRRANELARKRGVTAIQIALAWILGEGEHVFAVVGPRTCDEIAGLFRACDLRLSSQERAWLNLEIA